MRVSLMFDQFNFDMLKAMIEEMNRYGESPKEVMNMINARPEFSGNTRYTVELVPINSTGPVPQEMMEDKIWTGNPLTEELTIAYKVPDPEDSSDYNWERACFTTEHLRRIEAVDGQFIYINDTGEKLVLKRMYSAANAYQGLF